MASYLAGMPKGQAAFFYLHSAGGSQNHCAKRRDQRRWFTYTQRSCIMNPKPKVTEVLGVSMPRAPVVTPNTSQYTNPICKLNLEGSIKNVKRNFVLVSYV